MLAHHCCTLEGLVVLRDHTNRVCGVATTVYRREQGPWRFDQKLDSEDGGERSGRGLPKGTPETHLHVGKARSYPRSYPTGSLALARDSFHIYIATLVVCFTLPSLVDRLVDRFGI